MQTCHPLNIINALQSEKYVRGGPEKQSSPNGILEKKEERFLVFSVSKMLRVLLKNDVMQQSDKHATVSKKEKRACIFKLNFSF